MGSRAPWLVQVQAQATKMPWPTQVLVDVNNMAQLMARSDLALGAAGSTSWERCCLGLPTIMFTLADNQKYTIRFFFRKNISFIVNIGDNIASILKEIFQKIITNKNTLSKMTEKSIEITDGKGTKIVARALISISESVSSRVETLHPAGESLAS
jgi:spore coat polysaccharide biosynthesis predicted glycosyltransferase SpsG